MLSITEIQTAVESVVKNTAVEKMVLFGSYAKRNASTQSDIDLFMVSNGVITGLAFYDLKSRIEGAFNVNVDLLADLDVIPNSPIEKQINDSGVIIYERQR